MYTFAAVTTAKMNYRKEHLIYALIWILLYLSPVMGLYMRMSGNPHVLFSWTEILNAWRFNTIWLALFAIHNFLLAPILIVRRRTWLYLTLSAVVLSAAMVALYLNRPLHRRHMRHMQRSETAIRHGQRPDGDERRPHHMRHERRPEMGLPGPMMLLGPGEMVGFIGGLLLMGMNLGVKLYFRSQEDHKALALIEKQNLEHQLEYLKYQVNPHFFMNTLNNIHALVDIDPERAKTTIVELSKMMRYILYEGNNKQIQLPREVQFLRNYVQLMSLRYTDRVRISIDVHQPMPDLALPPLLLIIFVENAFKHGISYQTDSFVDIDIATSGRRLLFSCRNSRQPKPPTDTKGGMGLVNVRRRLDLIFGADYSLRIDEQADTYGVQLDIPLKADTDTRTGTGAKDAQNT